MFWFGTRFDWVGKKKNITFAALYGFSLYNKKRAF